METKLTDKWIGKAVLVRSYNEGVNAGIVVAAHQFGVELKNARRLWRHRPADMKLSWYEGVAISGISDSTLVSASCDKLIIEDYSLTLCSEKAIKSIYDKTPHPQDK